MHKHERVTDKSLCRTLPPENFTASETLGGYGLEGQKRQKLAKNGQFTQLKCQSFQQRWDGQIGSK